MATTRTARTTWTRKGGGGRELHATNFNRSGSRHELSSEIPTSCALYLSRPSASLSLLRAATQRLPFVSHLAPKPTMLAFTVSTLALQTPPVVSTTSASASNSAADGAEIIATKCTTTQDHRSKVESFGEAWAKSYHRCEVESFGEAWPKSHSWSEIQGSCQAWAKGRNHFSVHKATMKKVLY